MGNAVSLSALNFNEGARVGADVICSKLRECLGSTIRAMVGKICCNHPCELKAERRLTGIMNFTNPGAISHNQILELYKQYIDPELTWSNFTVEEQAKVIKAPRSNNLLDTTRVWSLPSMFSHVSDQRSAGLLMTVHSCLLSCYL